MKKSAALALLAQVSSIMIFGAAAHAADEADMMTKCNRYAAHHLHVSTSDIADLKYEGTRSDGTHAVNGKTSAGQSFQCSFGPQGNYVVGWTHGAPAHCPVDVSEADRFMYPACN